MGESMAVIPIERLARHLRRHGIDVDVSPDKGTGIRVFPVERQAEAQPFIDAFNPDDPVHEAAERDEAVDAHALGADALVVVGTILLTTNPAAFDGMTPDQARTAIRASPAMAQYRRLWRLVGH